MKIFFLFIILLAFSRCHRSAPATTDMVIIQPGATKDSFAASIIREDFPCRLSPGLDTVFPSGVRLRLTARCADDVRIFDTVFATHSTSIRAYQEIFLEASVSAGSSHKQLLISKESFGDSLAADLREGGLMMFPYEVKFEKADSSIRMRSFVGFPESDFGDIYYFKINTKGELKVLAVEETKTGDDNT